MKVQKAMRAVGCYSVSLVALANTHPKSTVTYQHHPLQPDRKPKELHPLLHSLLVTPPARSLHHGESRLEPSRPVQDEEKSDTHDEGGTTGTEVRASD
jgi:hypothetical protein